MSGKKNKNTKPKKKYKKPTLTRHGNLRLITQMS